MSEPKWDVVIVGASGAGLSAGLMLGRARRRALIVDGGEPRNRYADAMHGVLGHDGLAPTELIDRGRSEVARYGVEVRRDAVDGVGDRGETLDVVTRDGALLSCRALIAASGLTDELPDVPGLAERWGSSVLHCPYCHGWEVRDRRLGVLATSALALHQVQLVRQWSDRVVFFSAGAGELDHEAERRLTARGIEIVDSPVFEVLGSGASLTAVRTADGIIDVDAIFTMGVARPRDRYLAGLELCRYDTPFGSFVAVDASGRTSHPRVWAAGNVTDPAANVASAISAGAVAGAMVNMALVTEDFDAALAEADAA